MRFIEEETDKIIRSIDSVFMVCSKFSAAPSAQNFQYKYALNEEIKITPTDGTVFEVAKLFIGIYSMPGSKIRFGYGFLKDPFGSNNALRKGNHKVQVNQVALAKEVEAQRNLQIEEEIFSQNQEQNANPGRFRK